MPTITIELADSIHNRVVAVAAQEGFTVDQFVNSAVADKLSAIATETELGGRAKRGDRAKFEAVLSRVQDASASREIDLLPRHREEIRRLLRETAPEAEVWAYGSRVTGGSHEGSDLDLVVRDPDDPDHPQGALLARLREAFVDSNIPFLIDLHDWATLPESYRREIERHHVPIGARP